MYIFSRVYWIVLITNHFYGVIICLSVDMLNHSFQPNCFLHWRFKDRMLEVLINAGQRIKKGDEVTEMLLIVYWFWFVNTSLLNIGLYFMLTSTILRRLWTILNYKIFILIYCIILYFNSSLYLFLWLLGC